MTGNVWHVTPTGAGAAWTWAEANARARFGDELDMHGTFGPLKTGRDGLRLDFGDARVKGSSEPALLLLDADYTKVIGGEFFGSKAGGIVARYSDNLIIFGPEIYANQRHAVSIMLSDRIHVEDVYAHGNATEGATSAISVHHLISKDDLPNIHVRILKNRLDDNGSKTHKQPDGNGISIDDLNGTQPSKEHGGDQPYFGHRVLVEGNTITDSGGQGIGVFWSDFVSLIDNTVKGNQLQAVFGRTPDVEIEVRQSRHGVAIGNDLGDGDMLISGTAARPAEVSGHGNHYDDLVLRGVVLGDYDGLGVEAAQMHWDL